MGGTDKTFADVRGSPLIAHTLRRIAASDAVDRIVLVVAPDAVSRRRGDGTRAWRSPKSPQSAPAAPAGRIRCLAGLVAMGDCGDGLRCTTGRGPASRRYPGSRSPGEVRGSGAAIAGGAGQGYNQGCGRRRQVISDTPDRATLWAAQTPQAFDYRTLLDAHRAAEVEYTDDAAMVEAAGHQVTVFWGELRKFEGDHTGRPGYREFAVIPGVGRNWCKWHIGSLATI